MRLYTVGGRSVVVSGRVLKIGRLEKEFYEDVNVPHEFLQEVEKAAVWMDIFTFLHGSPATEPKFDHIMQWDTVAAIRITSFEKWHRNDIPKQTRRALRKSTEMGVEVRPVQFNDDFIKGIMEIFNERPIRQGKPFWHYGKDFLTVKAEMSRDLERSRFLGAFCNGELIGFAKLICAESYARAVQLISRIAHRPKYPNNALIAKAVEMCAERRIPYLVFGQFEYGKVGSKTLMDFKVHNGFRKVLLPRYYVPLTEKGALSLRLGFQEGLVAPFPKLVLRAFLRMRATWYARIAHG
jgi:hypothetical protein